MLFFCKQKYSVHEPQRYEVTGIQNNSQIQGFWSWKWIITIL